MTQSDLADFRKWISESMEKIPSELAGKNDLFVSFNEKGKKPPIYWCFNSWVEAICLAKQLGADQPLFAMLSFYEFPNGASSMKMHTISLGTIYGDLLLQVCRAEPIFIGGNCQAAPIAEAIAHFLLAKTEATPILITLEHQPFYSYPGNVVMLFGSRSEKFNPFLRDEDPIPRWKKKYGSPSWGIVDGEHGEYFFQPAVFDLAKYMNTVAEAFSNGVQSRSGPLRIAGSQAVWHI
jgi:hypothetical protein